MKGGAGVRAGCCERGPRCDGGWVRGEALQRRGLSGRVVVKKGGAGVRAGCCERGGRCEGRLL